MLNKQAKILTMNQQKTMLSYLSTTRHPLRNQLIFRFSLNAGLRAKEIAAITWDMVTDVESKITSSIRLTNLASKGNSGRVIPINKHLLALLIEHYSIESSKKRFKLSDNIITSQKQRHTKPQTIVNMFSLWYETMGFVGASSHSGRRTFITNVSRKIGNVGGSMRDVQSLAGHSSLQTTQRYIEQSTDSQQKVVDLI
jgi:integrase/recombinase XerD